VALAKPKGPEERPTEHIMGLEEHLTGPNEIENASVGFKVLYWDLRNPKGP
jgi:hypothetical protein